MTLLLDAELRSRITKSPPELIEGIDPKDVDRVIRGCAVDLHIGAVFRPGSKPGEPGSADKPHQLSLTLEEGETALIRTREKFKLGADFAAFVYPVSAVSMKGLLMTNPGHVDPGYEGHVHVTVINMGREPYALEPNGRLLRAVIHCLNSNVKSPYVNPPGTSPVTDEMLGKLSPDFLSIKKRAAAAVRDADRKAVALQFALPILFSIVAVIVAHLLDAGRYNDRLDALEAVHANKRLDNLEANYRTTQRLDHLQTEIDALQAAKHVKQASLIRSGTNSHR